MTGIAMAFAAAYAIENRFAGFNADFIRFDAERFRQRDKVNFWTGNVQTRIFVLRGLWEFEAFCPDF